MTLSGGLGGLVHYLAGTPIAESPAVTRAARNVKLLAELPRCGDSRDRRRCRSCSSVWRWPGRR